MKVLAHIPERWRKRLDHWPIWMAIAFFGLVVAYVWMLSQQQRTAKVQAEQAKIAAIRVAETRATAQSAYRRCVDSIPQLKAISTHVGGVNEGFSVILRNSLDSLQATPKDDPLYHVRLANFQRLERAVKAVAAVKAFPVPTLSECKQRRTEALRGIR